MVTHLCSDATEEQTDEIKQQEEPIEEEEQHEEESQKPEIEEETIQEREKELTQSNILPETETDYERLLVASPTSSYIWIQYMAYKLSSADIEAAREIGNRAIKVFC